MTSNFPKFHASLDGYLDRSYRKFSQMEEVKRWMKILLAPPKDTKDKKKAGEKLHAIYPDWNPASPVWYSGFLLDWLILSATDGKKVALRYADGQLISDVHFDNVPEQLRIGNVAKHMTIYGKSTGHNHFVAETMSTNDDIVHFTHSDLLQRVSQLGFEVPDTILHLGTTDDVLKFLTDNPNREFMILVDYMYYRECVGSSTAYPMWCVRYAPLKTN